MSRLLSISRPTLYRWLQHLETSGSTTPQPRRPPPQPAKIKDWHKFKEFVDSHGDKTKKKLAQL
ncbi:MAG: hypothetical protein F6J89_14995 [Symploca sp. SIO1C4]|uniref:Helix-turn-helix domain-containing protein n=1 Tax=Symploca sp. SIO1C4 TaxID=2607765 RepID=A0A6B3NGZ2_9CYAN|nr:hypothetical protein [Symploca sp. SIO1C4]